MMDATLRERLMAQAAELTGRSMEGSFDKYADTMVEAVERIDALERLIERACPICGGACTAANPPVINCPMREKR